jgi:hypothetical protein
VGGVKRGGGGKGKKHFDYIYSVIVFDEPYIFFTFLIAVHVKVPLF